MKIFSFLGIAVVVLFFGCNQKSETQKAIDNIPVTIEIIRFDKEFAKATASDLSTLKNQFPLFFPKQTPDSIWVENLNDTLQQQLNQAVATVFPNEDELGPDLASLFQHIKYYFPDFIEPKIYTTTSDVDYRTRIIANDTLLLLELDTYLGSDHHFYAEISKYISKNLKPSQILPDIASIYASKYITPVRQRSFLAQMVYYGKQLYLKDLWLPELADAEKIGYTQEEMEWANVNEIQVWEYFVEKELLYSTDNKLPQRFINPAPFSKFNLAIDNESPGMIGRYIGWQIVRSFMNKNNVTVAQLMAITPEQLFKDANYKPKK